ncbi:MAG: GNAT family N-acetyltransferase [Lachnospiraceae bacterium]|nr:GNAT family N-acetyltransferase [Lachnospiraceae bacterium]
MNQNNQEVNHKTADVQAANNQQVSIQELNKEQIHKIYRHWMIEHFPQDEIKPWKSISRMWELGAYRGLGMFQEEKLLGYALFAQEPEGDTLLLDYFAMLETSRGQGLGGAFLRNMKNVMKDYAGILFETEDEAAAENEEQLQVRKRRNAFYEREGMGRTTVRSEVYGVQYMIWSYPFSGENIMDSEACQKKLTDIYKIMIPGEKFDKYVKITGR